MLLVIAAIIVGAALMAASFDGGSSQASPSAAPPPAENEITYDWNGQTIHFNRWAGVFGNYEYTTRNQRHFFRFNITNVAGEIRIYILNSPSYGSRSTDAHSTHRYYDAARGHYVCVKHELRPVNVPEALSWMVYWAEQTGKYIDTGRSFA